MRDPADDVGPDFHRLAHQLPTAVEAENPLLREGHELQIDEAAHLLAQIDERAQRA